MPASKSPWFISPKILIVLLAISIWGIIPILPLKMSGQLPDWNWDISKWGQKPPAVKPTVVAVTNTAALKETSPESLMNLATQELVKKIQASPQDPGLHNQLGLLYLSANNKTAALDEFTQAREVAESELNSLEQNVQDGHAPASLLIESSRLHVELSAALSNLARIHSDNGDDTQAVATLKTLKQTNVSSVVARLSNKNSEPSAELPSQSSKDKQIQLLLVHGQQLLKQGKATEATSDFHKVVELDPTCALAHHQLGLIAGLNQNHHLAQKELKEAIHLNPGDAIAHYNLGQAYQSLDKRQLAKNEFTLALALDPKLTDATISLSSLHAGQGDLWQAKHVLEQALKTDSHSALLHNNLASIYSQQGQYEEAINQYQEALSVNPDSASSHYGLGLALFKLKNYRQCISEFKRALALNPGILDAQRKIELAGHLSRSNVPGA